MEIALGESYGIFFLALILKVEFKILDAVSKSRGKQSTISPRFSFIS